MRLVVVGGIALLAGAGFLFFKYQGSGSVSAASLMSSDKLYWDVSNDKNSLTPTLNATAKYHLDEGGTVNLKAVCSYQHIAIEVRYHANSSNPKDGEFVISGGPKAYVSYKWDNNPVQTIGFDDAEPDYIFMGVIPAEKTDKDQEFTTTNLVKAHELSVQLPVNGKSVVFKIYPQDSSFKKFLAGCSDAIP